jgi:hypothetical protein
MKGTYQHCSEKHLHRYLVEFDFRHDNRSALGVVDTERVEILAKGISGERLTYRRPNSNQGANRITHLAKHFIAWREKVK